MPSSLRGRPDVGEIVRAAIDGHPDAGKLTEHEREIAVGVMTGAAEALVPVLDELKAEAERHRVDAERLAAALEMARGFLGMSIKSPNCAAYVADQALAAHSTTSNQRQER